VLARPGLPSRLTVLVIDDSAAIRAFIRVYLSGRNFDIVEAEDGERGLEIVHLLRVDLVIADIRMEGMDGIAFLRRVRANTEKRINALPVILLTADRSEDLRVEATKAGASDFVYKPVDGKNLRELVEKYLPKSGT
jgi:two-component system, chemotaxis family, chemotaxis protein CheY